MEPKKVAVVGAGFMGLVSIATLKSEGLHPVCFEKTENFGGTWCYREQCEYGLASTMSTTVINHSKELGAFSNFPPPKEFPNYMKHDKLYEYVSSYIKCNDCEKHIKYNTEVVAVKEADDYEHTGRWLVTTKDRKTQEKVTGLYDAVLVCTGHFNMPSMPYFVGQEQYKGKIIHTHSLKDVEGFANKTIVVVGIGCSALDAAVETSRVAKQVYVSTRDGAFIWNRVGPNGYPMDLALLRRYYTFLLEHLPLNLTNWYLETFFVNNPFNHKLMPVEPKHHVLEKDPIINDHITSKLLSGSVILKPNIHHFVEKGVVYEGDDAVTVADVIIMATGYTWAFPFLEDGMITREYGRINLYKCIYPPHLPHSTLAIMGFVNVYGPGFPVGEIQARWVAYNLANNVKLPPETTMMQDIVRRHENNAKRYTTSERMTIRVDFVEYMDEIAEQLGVKPNLLKYLFLDYPLFLKLAFGPSLSYQYRLEGHGKWEGARNAIMASHDRVKWPLQRRKTPEKSLLQRVSEYFFSFIPLNVYIHYF